MLGTLYARHEPTTDSATKDMQRVTGSTTQHYDVVLYSSRQAKEPVGRYPWHYTKPTHRNKYVMHNCARYHLVWLPKLQKLEKGG